MPERNAPTPKRPSGRARLARRWRSVRVLVEDRSMEPTLEPGDRLWVERRADVANGDLVVVRDPESPRRYLVKRVGATGGQRLFVTRSGAVLVPTGGSSDPPDDALEEVTVPPDHLFLLSDRPVGARDSRRFGPVACSLLVGRAWHRYFPRPRRGDL